MSGEGRAVRWLEPLLPAFPGLTAQDAAMLCRFEDALRGLLEAHPVTRPVRRRTSGAGTCGRSGARLARSGYLALAVPARDGGHGGHPATVQVLLQFICGYHDVDLRDSTGLGHGRLIAAHATPQVRDRWLPRLLAGAVPGIAITEPHGGTQVHATATHATPAAGGTWRVIRHQDLDQPPDRGRRLLRLLHRAGRGAHRRRHRRPRRRPVPPADHPGGPVRLGLGRTATRRRDRPAVRHPRPARRRDAAAARPLRPLPAPGRGDRTRRGSRRPRPDCGLLASRCQAGAIARVRDNALITLGRTWAQVNAALLAAVTAHQLAERRAPRRPGVGLRRSRPTASTSPTRRHPSSRCWPAPPGSPPSPAPPRPAATSTPCCTPTASTTASTAPPAATSQASPGRQRRTQQCLDPDDPRGEDSGASPCA